MSACRLKRSRTIFTSAWLRKAGALEILTRASSTHFLELCCSQSQSRQRRTIFASSSSLSSLSRQQSEPISPMTQAAALMTKSVGTTLSMSSTILLTISSPKLLWEEQFSLTSRRKLLSMSSERYSLPNQKRICMVSRYHLWVVEKRSARSVILRTRLLRKWLSVEPCSELSILDTITSTLSCEAMRKSSSSVSPFSVSSLLSRHSTMVSWCSSSRAAFPRQSSPSTCTPRNFMLLELRGSSSLPSTPALSRSSASLGQMAAMVRTHWQATATLMLLLVSSARRSTCSRMVQQCSEAFWSPLPSTSRMRSSLSWIQGAGMRWQSNSLGSLCSMTCLRMITKLPARSRYLRGLSRTSSRQRLREAAMTLGSRSQSAFFIFSRYSGTSAPVTCLIFCRRRTAFLRTRSVVWVTSLTTCSVTAPAMVKLSRCAREVRQMTISWTSPLVRSLMMVATSMMSRSLLLSKKSEHMRQPMRLRIRFLFCVRLMAWMWAKGAEWPSISMYMARMRCSLICLGLRFFSDSRGFSSASSDRMMRSSSCFDLVSPMLFISSFRSFERCAEAVVISPVLINYHPLTSPTLSPKHKPFCLVGPMSPFYGHRHYSPFQTCISKSAHNYSVFMFKHSIQQFKTLFEGDNIRDGSSLAALKEWGGPDALLKGLKTDPKNGLDDDEQTLAERLNFYGRNVPITKPQKTLWEMIVESFEDEMLRVLCVAAVVSLVLGIATEGLEKGWMEGTSILVAVVIIVTVTSGNNWVKEQQFKKLNAIAARKNVNVFRRGNVDNISVDDLTVGDIQIVETGEIISVDGFLLESHNLIADESAMTGEPLGIKKTVPTWAPGEHCNPFLISGSKILEGTGKMVVLAIGEHSQFGILKKNIQSSDDETPLQQKLSVLAEQIGHVGMVAAGLTFLCMLGHILHGAYASGDLVGSLFRLETLHHLVEAFIVAVSIIVVAVPEGLPLAVTIALAYSVGKMKEENNLVRFLQACETMGGADNICSDKTGTLTMNKMAVTRMFVQERTVDNIAKGFLPPTIAEMFSVGVALNSSANPIIEDNNGVLRVDQIGNKTDCALLEVAHILGYDYRDLRKKNEPNVLKVVPFSSATKTMSTVVNYKGRVHVFSKGAPDFLLKNCAFYLDAKGEAVPISDAFKNTLNGKLKEFADGTLRTLLIAFRYGQKENANTPNEEIESGLIVIGMVGIKDPIRPQVPHAVQQCYRAGVRVRMITGDNPETAVAIAKEAGILEAGWVRKGAEDYTVMTGQEFRTFVEGLDRDEEGNEIIKNIDNFRIVRDQLKVLARSSPTDKYIMATGLKQLHHVVAMTGDGTNDAPALKKADIGFAMGIAGTEVAKEASGIILLDDNFSSIVTAMKWGRNIFDSIRKFLQFQLTVNMCALIMAFAGAAVLKESPLSPIQMLWVNLIMDTLASLALATEPPSEELLERKPYSRFENLITPEMWKNIITQGLLQIVILGTILFRGPQLIGIQSSIGASEWTAESGKHYCIFFHTFVLLQVFNEINARKLKQTEINVFKNFFNNPLFIVILLLTLAIQFGCVQLGGQSLRTVPLTSEEHLLCLGLGALPLLASPLFKVLVPASLFNGLSKTEVPQ